MVLTWDQARSQQLTTIWCNSYLAIALPTYYSYFLALQLLRIIATS